MAKEKSLKQIVEIIETAKKNKVKNEYVDIQYVYQLVEALASMKDSQEILAEKYKKEKNDHNKTLCELNELKDSYESEKLETLQLKKTLKETDMYLGMFMEKLVKVNKDLDDNILRNELNDALGLSSETGKIFDMNA